MPKKNFFYCLKKHVIKKIVFLSCFRVKNFLFEKAKKTTVFSIVHTIHATISNQKWGSLLAVTLMLFGAFMGVFNFKRLLLLAAFAHFKRFLHFKRFFLILSVLLFLVAFVHFKLFLHFKRFFTFYRYLLN